MGLTASISTALSGITTTQARIDLVARNIANASTDGYTRKTLSTEANVAGGQVIGVLLGDVARVVDTFLQQQLRNEIAAQGNVDVRSNFLSLVDQSFGEPGGATGLDTIINEFTSALQNLATSPDQAAIQQATVASASVLAGQLNQLSEEVQSLRTQAEAGLAATIEEANSLLKSIATLNQDIAIAFDGPGGAADLQDQRDLRIDQLAALLDIRVSQGDRGTAKIFTNGGDLLLDSQPSTLSFDARGTLSANLLYSTDPTVRGVGTLTITDSNGGAVDLFASGTIRSGSIAAYRDLRDNILTEVQNELDELAQGIALSLSSTTVAGVAVSPGPGAGFDLDVSGLQSGNPITVTLTDIGAGTTQTITLVRVNDASVLPLPNSATADPNDTVVGIDFSGGLAAVATAISAALGANVTATSPSANTIRIVDDGTSAFSVDAVSATVTATQTTGGGVVLPLFVDNNSGQLAYTGSFDNGGQKTGFAGRITVNAAVVNDSSLLVAFDSTTASGDPARPNDLLTRFSENSFLFSARPGGPATGSPFSGTIAAYARDVISFQTGQAELVSREKDAQEIVTGTIQGRIDSETKVNVDVEVAQLIVLQNSFAANARVLSVIQELIDILLRV
jgi:flagellar hook-associated protein 1